MYICGCGLKSVAEVTVSVNDVAFLHAGETTWGVPIVGVTCTDHMHETIIVHVQQNNE